METASSEVTALPGCYLLVILGEPLCENHKEKILQRVAKGLLSWNTEETQCDLKHLEQVCDDLKTSQKSSGKTELLLQHSTDKLAVEVLFNPQIFTLKQCLRNLLLSPTGHKHVIHAGYSFTGSGSWILQDGIFRFHDFVDELSDPGVSKVLSLYPAGCSLKMHLHCSPTGDWVTNNLEKQAFSHFMHLSLNPPDSPNGVPGASSLLEFIEGSLETLEGEEKLEPSPLIGNIRFERPTMYIFPSGQGDCSLFGVTGFTMLIDGGFTRFPCFWKFVRHIERLDSIMITRINESNLWGILSLLRGKQESSLYLKIGYVFCNIVDKSINSSEEGVSSENGGIASIQSNPNDLTISIIEVGNEIASRLKRIGCNPHQCLRDPTPTQLTLYHKVGHGTLEMFILSPPRDSRLLKDFLAHWSSNKDSLPVVRTRSACKNGGQSGQDIAIPISDVMSICCLLIWKPSNPNDRITRILFPGSAPQSQIMEGLASLKELDLLQKRICTGSSLKQSKSKSTVKSTVRISETSSSTTTQKLSTRYRSASPSMRKTRVAYTKQSSTELGDKGGDSSESQSSPVRRKLISTSNQQTETSRATRVSTRESVKKTANDEKKSVKNVTEKKAKTRTSSTTRSTTNKTTSKSTSETTSEANETLKARPITSKQVRARVNSRRVSDKTTSETDNETKKEIQSCTTAVENGDSDFSDKKRETVEVCSEDDHRDSGKGSEDASPKKLPFLDHLRDEVEPDSLESYEIYGNVEISKDSLEHSEDEVVTGDSRSTSQLDHMISREDDDEDMKSRSSPIQEDSNLQSAMISSLSSNLSEMTVVSGDKNDDSASDLEVASLTSRINNQMSRSIEISHVEGSRRKSSDSNGSFRTLEAEIKAACEEEDRQSIGTSSRKSSILSDKRRDSIVKENIFASETISNEKQETEKLPVSERRRSSIISGDGDYRKTSISKEEFKLERKLSRSSEYRNEQEFEGLKVDIKSEVEVSTLQTVPNKEQEFESSKADLSSLEFKDESIERFSEKSVQNEMQISSEMEKTSGSLEDELPKGSIEEGENLRKDSMGMAIDKTVEERKTEESTIKSKVETSGQNDIESIVPKSKDNVNEAEVISKETDIDTKEILSTEKEKLLIDSSKSFDVSSELSSQSQSETSLESTKQTIDDKNKSIVQSAAQSLTQDSDAKGRIESLEHSQQSVIASIESTSRSKEKKQEEELSTLTSEETSGKVSMPSEFKAESKECDESVKVCRIDQEESNQYVSLVNQSKITSSMDSIMKISSEIASSKQNENKDLGEKPNIKEGDDIKQDSFTSRKESIKTNETFHSSEPASDETKSESRKSSMASGETKQQTIFDEMIDAKGVSLERASVSDVFYNEKEIGLNEVIKTQSSLSHEDRKETASLVGDRASISDDSSKQSNSSEAIISTGSQSNQIDRKVSVKSESATNDDSSIPSQTTRKDSFQSDIGKSMSGGTEVEVQYKTVSSTESKKQISIDTSSSSQMTIADSIHSNIERSSVSENFHKPTETEIDSITTSSIENDLKNKEDTKKIQFGHDEDVKTESSLSQVDRKESVQLKDVTSETTAPGDISSSQITGKDSVQSDLDKSKSSDSRRSTVTEIQFATETTVKSDTEISGDKLESSQINRKDSIQSDKDRSSMPGDSRRSTETEIQFKTITSMENVTEISDQTSSTIQSERKESVQFDKDRSSISDYSRKQSLASEATKAVESSYSVLERKESLISKDIASENTTQENSSVSSQTQRKDSVQADSVDINKSKSSDSRRSTVTEIQFKTETAVENATEISGQTSSSIQLERKESVQFDKDRSSISDDCRKQSLTSEAIKSIDIDENIRKESISQKDDKVFTDSVPASPLTKHQDKSDEIIQSTVKRDDTSYEVEKSTENIEFKNTQQSNLLEKVPFETENFQSEKSESILSDKKGDDDKKIHEISSQSSITVTSSSSSSTEKSDEQNKVTMSEKAIKYSQSESDIEFDATSAIKFNDESENNRITEHRRKPSIDMISCKLSTSSSTTDSTSTESKTSNTTAIINKPFTAASVDYDSSSMQGITQESSQTEVKEPEKTDEMISKDDSIKKNKASTPETTAVASTNVQSDTDSSSFNKLESLSSTVQPESVESYSKSISESQEKSMVQLSKSEKIESKASDSIKSSQAETKSSEVSTNLNEQIGKSEELDADTKLRKESIKENIEDQKISPQVSDGSSKPNEKNNIHENMLRKSSIDIKAQQSLEIREESKESDSKRSSIDNEIQKTYSLTSADSLEQKSIHEEESKLGIPATSQVTQKSEAKVEESKSNLIESNETISSEIEKEFTIKNEESSEKLQFSIVQQSSDFKSREQVESSVQKTSMESSLTESNDQRTSFTMDLSSAEDKSSQILASSVDEKSRKSTSEEVSDILVKRKDSSATSKTEASDNSHQNLSGITTQLSSEQSSELAEMIVDSKHNILQSSRSDSISETKQQLKDFEERREPVSKTSEERRSSLSTDSLTIREIFTTSDSDSSLSYSGVGSIVTTLESASRPDIKQETRLEESREPSEEAKDFSSQSANATRQFEEREQSTSTETVVSATIVDSKAVSSNMETTSTAKDVTSSGVTKLYLGQAIGFDSCEDSGSYEAESIQSPKSTNLNNNLVSSALKETSDDLASDLEVASLTSKMDGPSKSLITDESRKDTVEERDSSKEYESQASSLNNITKQLSSENHSSDAREQLSVKDLDDKLNIKEGDDIKRDSFTSRKESIKTAETFQSSEPAPDETKSVSRKSSMASGEATQKLTSKSIATELSNAGDDCGQFQQSFASQDKEMKSSLQIVTSDKMIDTYEANLKRESVSDVHDLKSRIDFDEDVKTVSSLSQVNRKESVQLKDVTSETTAPGDISSSQITRKDSVQSDLDKSKSSDSRRSTVTEIQFATETTVKSDTEISGDKLESSQINRKDSIQSSKDKSSISIDSSFNQLERKMSVESNNKIPEGTTDSPAMSQISRKDSVQSDFEGSVKDKSSMPGDSRRSTETEIQFKTITSMENVTEISDQTSSTIQSERKESVQFDKDRSSISDYSRKQSLASEATKAVESSYSVLERKESLISKDIASENTTQENSSVSSQTQRKDSVQADSVDINKSKSSDSRRSTVTEIQFKTETAVENATEISGQTSSSIQLERKESVQFDKDRSSISDDCRKQSLTSEAIKSIDIDENIRKESISQKDDKVFTDSVPASPLTKHQDKSDEIIQSTVKRDDTSYEVEKSTENIEFKNTQQSNLLEKVPFETENFQSEKSESILSDKKGDDDKKIHEISSQSSKTVTSSSSSSTEKSAEQNKVTTSEKAIKYSQSESDIEFDATSAIKSNDEPENNRITEHRRKPSIDMTSSKLSTSSSTTDSTSTESKTTVSTEQINFGTDVIGSSSHDLEARTSFIETNIRTEDIVDETKSNGLKKSEPEISASKSMIVDQSISLDLISATDSSKQSTSDDVNTSKSTTSGNTHLQSDDSFAQQSSEFKRESFSKIETSNQLYSTLTESFDDIQVDLQSTKSSNLISSNFSDAKILNKSESLSSENATHSTKFDTVMSIDEETYFYLEDSDSLAQDGNSMASISDKRVTKDKITLSEAPAPLSSTEKYENFASSTSEKKQQLFNLPGFSSSSDEIEHSAKTSEASQKSQIEMKNERQTNLSDLSQYETHTEIDGNKISNLVSESVQEKMIIKSSNESGSTVMIEERSSIDYKPTSSFSESSCDPSSESSKINQTNVHSENLMNSKEEMDKYKSISSTVESQLETFSDGASSEGLSSEVPIGESSEASLLTSEGFSPMPTFKIKKNAFPFRSTPQILTNIVSSTKSFTTESIDPLEGEQNQDRHHTEHYKDDEEIQEKIQSPILSNQSSAKLTSPTLSPLPGQNFDKLSRDIVDKGVSLRSLTGTELASSIVHLETSTNKVTTNLNLPEVISEEAGSRGEESPDLPSPKQSTNDFIAKVETAPGAGTLATTFPTAVEMPSVHLRRSAQMAGQVLYEVPDEEDNIDSPLSEKKQVGLARGTTSSKEFPEVLHISEETTPSTPSETQSPKDAKSLNQTTTATTTSMDITSPQDSKSGLCCFPRSIEMDGAKKGKEEKVTSASTSETITRVITHSQNLTEEQKKEKEATLKEWGTPLGLPKPPDANDSKGARSASKSRATSSDRTGASRSYSSRRSGSSSDQGKPIYLDLAYIPHHGDRHYCNADYFKRIRARYYVLSSVNPSKEVLDALIEGKKCWEDKTAEVTLIPSHETEALCLWMATNQQTLEDLNIDVAPSASRCSVILQDQESSCSAYRVEF